MGRSGITTTVSELPMARDQSFSIVGTGAEDFWQGYENFKSNFMGYKNNLLEIF